MTDNAGNKTGNKAAYLCKVVGVTSANPDGESRQQIIQNIIEKQGRCGQWTGTGKLNVTRYVDIEEGRNEPAIEVLVDGKLIGYVPKARIEDVASNKKTQSGSVLVQLSFVEQYGVYSAKLFTPNKSKPTKKMEVAVNRILRENPHLEPPDKTFDAYRAFLNKYHGGRMDQTFIKVKNV